MKINKQFIENLWTKISNFCLKTRIRIYFSILVISILIYIGFLVGNNWICEFEIIDSIFDGFLNSFPNLILDICFIGIVLSIFEYYKDKNEKIDRYKDEIDDFREWKSEEAKYRILGSIKRLSKLKVDSIDLSRCYMPNISLENIFLKKVILREIDFEGAQFNKIDLRQANLNQIYFNGAELYEVDFRQSYMNSDIKFINTTFKYFSSDSSRFQYFNTDTSFSNSRLLSVIFDKCNLSFIDFSGADLFKIKFYNTNNLAQAVFKNAILINVDFGDSNLFQVDFSGASLDNVDLSSAKNITYEQLNNVKYIKATNGEYKIPEEILNKLKRKNSMLLQ